MATIQFIYEGAIIHTENVTVGGNAQAQVASQYRNEQFVEIDGTDYIIDRITHNMDSGTVDIYLSNSIGEE